MRIVSWYRGLFYTLSSVSRRVGGEVEIPHISALFLLSVFLLLNVVTFLVIVDYISGRTFLTQIGFGKVFGLIVFAAIVAANYLLFIKDEKYKQLPKEFESETSDQKKLRFVLALSYGLISFFGFWGLLFLLAPKN